MEQQNTLLIEIFNKKSFEKYPREAAVTIVDSENSATLEDVVETHGLEKPDVVHLRTTVREGLDGMTGRQLSSRNFYIVDDEMYFKPIENIPFAGDYADQERREMMDYYDEKGVTHVVSIGGSYCELDDASVVLTREGERLWPKPENAVDTVEQKSDAAQQRHVNLRKYLRNPK